jgi:hypothetical protein
MTEADWKDIAIIGRTSEKEIDDRVEVEWKLSAKPELEWAEIFQRNREISETEALEVGLRPTQVICRWTKGSRYMLKPGASHERVESRAAES